MFLFSEECVVMEPLIFILLIKPSFCLPVRNSTHSDSYEHTWLPVFDYADSGFPPPPSLSFGKDPKSPIWKNCSVHACVYTNLVLTTRDKVVPDLQAFSQVASRHFRGPRQDCRILCV